MNWIKQKLEFLQKVSPKKVILGSFVLMFLIELIVDVTTGVSANLLIGVLLMFYGLYLLKHKDYSNLKFLFLLLFIVKIATLILRAL